MTQENPDNPRPEFACYAESRDGIHWTKPALGLIEFNCSKQNNMILSSRDSGFPVSCFVPFKDANPKATEDAKYRAWAVGGNPLGLHP